MKSLSTLVLLGALASQLPSILATNSCGAAGSFTDTFEDQTPAAALTPTLNAPVKNPYHGLKYSNGNVQKITTPNLAPKTPTNVLGLFITDNLMSGSLTMNPKLTTSAFPPNTPAGARTFDLQDFYFGCIVPAFQTAVNVAQACSIAVTGQHADGSMAGELDFGFANTDAPLGQSNSMVRANVAERGGGDYRNLVQVNVTIVQATGTGTLAVLFVDSVRHVNYC